MNEKQESNNNVTNIEEIKNKKIINPNIINKKIYNKNSMRKQKRLFQMQKRLVLLNEEEEISELETEKKSEKYNNLKSFQKYAKNKNNQNKKQNINSLSFNYSSNHKGNINKEMDKSEKENIKENNCINLEIIIDEKKELNNEKNKKLKNKVENMNNKDENKDEEISLKKKNTNSNTNDEGSEVVLYSEFEQNKKKNINQNDSIDAISFTKIINEDNDENINIFSKNNENYIDEKKEIIKDKLNSKNFKYNQLINDDNNQGNFFNNFYFCNIDNDDSNDNLNKNEKSIEIKNEENAQNTGVIINEDHNENNNTFDNKDNNEEENVELNISNLEIDINEINNDNNYIQNEDQLVISGSHSNEFAKKYLSSKSKSFIKFSNNLTARVAARNLKNSPSYILALCPELLERFDKKNIIRDNYAVTDAISEEMESDTFTPRQSEKMDYSINKNTIDYNQSIHTNEYQVNNTLRNKDITDSSKFEFFLDKIEQITPKCYNKNKNKNKINKNRIKDINIELKDLNNDKKKKINAKSYATSINPINNIFSTNNNKNGILKNSDKKINDSLKIKIRHQKAKSSLNNNLTNFLNLNGSSPKQVTFKYFNYQNSSKGIIKNSGNKKILYNKEKTDIEKENLRYKEKKIISNNKYSSNNSQNNKIIYKKMNSNGMMINNLKLCKSEKKTKNLDSKLKYNNLKKNNMQILSKSNPNKHGNTNNKDKKKNICYTEKRNKSKNYITFISHMKKNTQINTSNMTEQNINHSKKLSQQICDGYKFFMNSLNTHNNNYNNRIKEINKINMGLNNFDFRKTPLSNYFSFNKNNKIINNNTIYKSNYNNSIIFINKKSIHKDDKISNIVVFHNKSKTTFMSPSYQNININKIYNKNYGVNNNNKNANKNKIPEGIKKYIKKKNHKFNEIKKIVNESSVRVYHKKINTIGNSNDLTKLLSNNLANGLNKQLKDSASNNNLRKNFNKHKIIMALQHIKFLPNENYSKALNELYKSKKNLFIILVYTDSIQRYIFRGLYEINSNDHKTANKLFAPGYSQNIINISSLNYFFNYQSNNGEFVKTKFNDEYEKKFGADTIMAY